MVNKEFVKKAERFRPQIYTREYSSPIPVAFVEDEGVYQNIKAVFASEKESYCTGDRVCLDFGRHITGYFKFFLGQYQEYMDAPIRLKLKFAELPYEAYRDFDTYKPGLCSSWLQEERITVDTKGEVRLGRRYAFRYVEISVLASSVPVTLKNFTATACSSADVSELDNVVFEDKTMKNIDKIAVCTLAECMQDVFEDGPKRDRRLWLGDLRLQALANYYTFENIDLVKRCLYLFASFDSKDQLLPSYVYTKPQVETGQAYLVSYALFFAVALCDYYEHTQDKVVTEDLFDTAKRQIDITKSMLDENGILVMPKNYGWWTFIDWSEAEPVTACMGIYIYTVKKFTDLCKKLGLKKEAYNYHKLAEKLKKSSLKFLYDGDIFKNNYDKNQYSVHSQVWMILADVVSKDDAKRLLKECVGNKTYVNPVTPYMHHYVVEALFKAEMYSEAKQYIVDYWGSMAELGADTFWEVFVKDNQFCSPYGDALMNSACHAWSCTPAYFTRKYNMQ